MTPISAVMPYPVFILIRRSVDELENESPKIEKVFAMKDVRKSPWHSLEAFQTEMIKNFNVREHEKISFVNKEGEEILINSQSRYNQALELAQSYIKMGKAVPLIVEAIDLNKNILNKQTTKLTADTRTSTDIGENDSTTRSLPAENEQKSNEMQSTRGSADLPSGNSQTMSHGNPKEESTEKLRDQECVCNSATLLDTCNGNVGKNTNSIKSLPADNEQKFNEIQSTRESTDLAAGNSQMKSHENPKEGSTEKLRAQECACSSAAQLDTCNGNVEQNNSNIKSLPAENVQKSNEMQSSKEPIDLTLGSTQIKSHENSKQGGTEKLREQECACSSGTQLNTNVERPNSNPSQKSKDQGRSSSEYSLTSIDESPPMWFIKYQNTVKNEIVEEVSAKVTMRIAKMLKKTAHDARKITEERKNAEIESKYYLRQVKAAEERLRKLQHKLEYTHEYLKEEKLRKQIIDILNELRDSRSERPESSSSKSAKYVQMEHFLSGRSNVSEASNIGENEIRMNCSITGQQMLSDLQDEDDFYNISSQYSVSTSSDVSNLTDSQDNEDDFKIIHMPSNSNDTTQREDIKPNEKTKNLVVDELLPETHQNENNNSNCDSPSFELLSQTSSTPLSICIDEDHFSTNESSIAALSSLKTDLSELDIRYAIDENCKIFDDVEREKSSSAEDEKPNKLYVFAANDLSAPDNKQACSALLKSAQVENAELNFDVKSSHSSYPDSKLDSINSESKEAEAAPNQRSCQSQTDSGEFAQSFHSHTTSISTDNELYSATMSAGTSSKPAADEGKRTQNRTDADKQVPGKNVRKNPRKLKMGNFNGTELPKARWTGEPVDPVYILPEIITSGASSIASMAYSSARDFFEKLRAQAREDSPKPKNTD